MLLTVRARTVKSVDHIMHLVHLGASASTLSTANRTIPALNVTDVALVCLFVLTHNNVTNPN